jgi:hypothetical protein
MRRAADALVQPGLSFVTGVNVNKMYCIGLLGAAHGYVKHTFLLFSLQNITLVFIFLLISHRPVPKPICTQEVLFGM